MIRYPTFGFLFICLLLGACKEQGTTDSGPELSIQADTHASSQLKPALAKDFLQPQKIMLRDMPPPLFFKIPKSERESYEYIDQNNNVRKIIPPSTHQRPYLQSEKGEPIFDQNGHPYFLGDGGTAHFTTFTTDDGLALDNITSSLLDQSGNIWFGTWGGGISKFDGISFTNYTTAQGLANNLVHCMTQDPKGNIWIGTDGGGISIYDGFTFSTITKSQGLANDVVYGIIADRNGNMWIATGAGGASKFDGTEFINYDQDNGLPSNFIIKIAEDKMGHIWFATGNKGISKYDGTSFTHFTTEDGLVENTINCITLDSSGNLWFGTKSGGVSKYQVNSDLEGKGFFTNYSINDGLGHHEIWKITEDRKGNIWFATGGGGISKYDGKKFTNYTTAQGLSENRVNSITEDLSGNLWFGTAGGGICLYHGTAFSNFNTNQGLAKNKVYGITEDNEGNLWFGTDGGGVSKYNGTAFTNFTTEQGLANPLVISAFKDQNGNLWFGTGGGGVSLYKEVSNETRNSSFTTYTSKQGLQNDIIYAILEDRMGNLWFGTGGGGLIKFDGNIVPEDQASFTPYSTTNGLAENTVYSLCEDRNGNLWIGTAGGGVSKFDGKSFTNYTTEHGLSNNIVWSILEDKSGNLWFATQGGGVSRYDGNTFGSFTTMEGLVDDTVNDIVEDEAGSIFIGTNRGFTVIPAHVVGKPFSEIRPNLEYYTTAFGYPVKDVNTGMFLDSRGILWAGNGSDKTGLVKFDYRALAKKITRPIASIKNIRLNEKAINWKSLLSHNSKDNTAFITKTNADEIGNIGNTLIFEENQQIQEDLEDVKFSGISRFDNFPKDLILPYSHNHVTIEFGTDELARPNLVEYKYILEGYTKNWSSIIKNNTATFGNIWEGDYTFKVMARYTGPSEDDVKTWSDQVVYKFSVLPPWYRSRWAYALYTIFLLVGLRRVHVFQKNKTIRKERYLTQKRELEQAKEIEKAYKELKITQAQLIQSEKMASLGELTAGIAHEIQNPLNFVNNFSEVSSELVEELKEVRVKSQQTRPKTDEDELENEILEDIKNNLEKITQHGKRADAIVKGMLEHSRAHTGEKIPTDLNALCEEYLRLSYHGMLAKDKLFNVNYLTDLDPNLPIVDVVPQDFGRVLLNIINNAFQAVGAGSPLTKQPTVTLATKNLEDGIQVSISDNGPGIPDAIKDKIFQPFFTTKPTGQGTGLGLSLSYDIIKAHGGELKVESQENMGTTFYIYLKK